MWGSQALDKTLSQELFGEGQQPGDASQPPVDNAYVQTLWSLLAAPGIPGQGSEFSPEMLGKPIFPSERRVGTLASLSGPQLPPSAAGLQP